jgi:hypothetical protein
MCSRNCRLIHTVRFGYTFGIHLGYICSSDTMLYLSEELEVEIWELRAIQAIELDAWYLSLEFFFNFDSPTEFCLYAPVARTDSAKFTSLKHVHVRGDLGYSMETIKLFVDCLFKGKDVQLHF